MPSAWAQLPSGLSSSDLPPLLYKSEFNSTGYSIFITDLDFIWTESLDRRQIFKRALNENTSIDPSEDPSQMKILLQKIQAALRGDAGTSLSLSLPEGQRLLILTITAPLPAPLSPLEWIMRLELHPQDALREELILPLLNAQVTLSQRAESLIGMIREKDHVIARLVDKLEASGTDLASLFPGAAGLMSRNKGSSREVIAKVVRGLGEFDEEEWNAQLKGNTNSLRDVSFVVDTSTLEGLVEKLEKSRRTSTWWDHFGQKRLDINLEEATARAQPTKGSHSKISASENIEDSKDSDDEFQVRGPNLSTLRVLNDKSGREPLRASNTEKSRLCLRSK